MGSIKSGIKKKVEIYTDGACRGNPGPGGWGVLLRYESLEKELSGAMMDTTNNQMELMAAIMGLRALKECCDVVLVTDSNYVKKGILEWLPVWEKRAWRTASNKPVKNQALWVQLSKEAARHQIQWRWVKGHSGHRENEIADTLAREAIDKLIAGKKEDK